MIVVKRAVGPRDALERLVGRAERCRQHREIGVLGHGVGANQYAVGAKADRSRATLCCDNDAAGQQIANAIDFRAGARLRRC